MREFMLLAVLAMTFSTTVGFKLGVIEANAGLVATLTFVMMISIAAGYLVGTFHR